MTQHRCEQCNRDFESQESLEQHNQAKHTTHDKKEKKPIKKNNLVVIVLIILILIGVYFLFFSKPAYTPQFPDSDNVKGNGTMEIIEFSDFQCPACGAAYPEVKKLMSQYGDKVKFIYKHFPISSHVYAFKAAEAAECAGDQGKFWEYHDILFDNQKNINTENMKKYARDLNLDTEKFNKCLNSGVMISRVSKDQNEGLSKGVGGTPTFFINGQKYAVIFNLEKFKQILGL